MRKDFPSFEEIKEFLQIANRSGYGNPDVKIKPTVDGGQIIQHQSGDWCFSDRFYGGQPYAGQEIIYYKDDPVWAMQYRGWLTDESFNSGDIYSFLRKALLEAPDRTSLARSRAIQS